MDENPIQQPIQPLSLPKRSLKLPLTILLVAILGIAGYAGASYYLNLWPFEVSVPVPTFTPRPSLSVTPVSSVMDTSTVDCGIMSAGSGSVSVNSNTSGSGSGTASVSYDANSLTAKTCFEQKFQQCQPAKIIAESFGIQYYYEITAPNGNYCFVKSKFITNPNPTWINKEMLCSLDPKKDFQTAIQDLSHCAGELYNLMTGK